MYNDILQNSEGPFLNHLCSGAVQRVQFCPFEDVLGVGHLKGFSSLIVPGNWFACLAFTLAQKEGGGWQECNICDS